MKLNTVIAATILFISSGFILSTNNDSDLDKQLKSLLNENKFDGKIQEELQKKLGRKLSTAKVNLGRLIFFDKGLGLHQDNSCAGCHAPNLGFGDSQPMAIGVTSNDTVGIHRKGPRNQRRTPTVVNTAFYPSLMWNGRFTSLSNDPFDNSDGFDFPPPEGDILFFKGAGYLRKNDHLLVAQAHIPFTEQPEMAGFTTEGENFAAFSRFSGLTINSQSKHVDGSISKQATPMIFASGKKETRGLHTSICADIDFSIFNDGKGLTVPPIDSTINSANFGIRDKVLTLINENSEYKKLFGEIYPSVKSGKPVNFIMVGEVLAEFEFSLTFAKAPIDQYAIGNTYALTQAQKRGAIIFFSKGKCVICHAVSDESNQMFSDFKMHNAGVPQIHPVFGVGTGNVPFSDLTCPKSETGTLDFGREEFTGSIEDRYKFRSSPLRNIKLQPFFFHNGSFNSLRDAVNFHLNPSKNIVSYLPSKYGVPQDLQYRKADMIDVMKTLDPILKQGIKLSKNDVEDLLAFLSEGLFDKRLTTDLLKSNVPLNVPSGLALQFFEFDNTNEKITLATTDEEDQKHSAISFSMYPNPVRDILYVNASNAGISKMEIIDASGQVRISQKTDISQKALTVKLQKLQPGVYFIRLTDKNGKTVLSRIMKG